jgi:predicted transcriptional regulator
VVGVTPRQKIHITINNIAQQYGYTVEDILGPSRLMRLVAVRRLCIIMLREKGYSTTEIGRLLNRCHTTVVHALNKPVDTCNQLLVRTEDQQRKGHNMWTKDERIAALLPQVIEHVNEHDEFSLDHEAQMEAIRDEYMADRLNDYRGETADGFEEWHGQPTVEEFVVALFDA